MEEGVSEPDAVLEELKLQTDQELANLQNK